MDISDCVDLGPVEHLEKLAGVGTKGLDITPLSLGVKGLENQRRFPAAAESGNDGQLPERDIEIETLEVILSDPAELNTGVVGFQIRGGIRFEIRDGLQNRGFVRSGRRR